MNFTAIKACHNKRRYRNKVFKGLVKHSKSSMGYFYGFKLHVIINNKGEFMALKVTKGNVDDRVLVPELTKRFKDHFEKKKTERKFATQPRLIVAVINVNIRGPPRYFLPGSVSARAAENIPRQLYCRPYTHTGLYRRHTGSFNSVFPPDIIPFCLEFGSIKHFVGKSNRKL